MLTKSHLKYTTRGGKIFPKYVKPNDPKVSQIASSMEAIFKDSVGKTALIDLEKQLKAIDSSSVNDGLQKLLEDRCEFSDGETQSIEECRWESFRLSFKARRVAGSMDEFEKILDESQKDSLSQMRSKLYSDRPSLRKIATFAPINSEDLIHRYNSAQIQGLILFAKELRVTIKEKNLSKKRRLIQKAKFHGLIMSVQTFEEEDLVINLGGPLSVFEGSSSYGARLANFFPYILQTELWSIVAEVKLKQKTYTLSVDSKRTIKTHYDDMATYLPGDLKDFLDSLNKNKMLKELGWVVSEGEEAISFGKNNICFPDISFSCPLNSKKIHLEIFHKWHSASLIDRLQSMTKSSDNSVIIAYPKKFVKNSHIKRLSESAKKSGVKIVEYSSFPTARAVLAYLKA